MQFPKCARIATTKRYRGTSDIKGFVILPGDDDMQGELRQVADLALFAKIVQTGGISRCAEDLGMERTTISRRLGSLERELGVKLLDRSPKHMLVTDAGRRCLEQCEMLLDAAKNAYSLATVGEVVCEAPIVVGAPPDIIDRYLERLFCEFEAENTGIRIERQPISDWSRKSVESVDFGIALAPLDVDVGWSTPVAYLRQSIYANADYAARHDAITTPFDLQSHDLIIEKADANRGSWRFEWENGVTTVTVKPRFLVSGMLEAREATLAGLGISRLPHYLCEPYLESGRLVDLMPDTESMRRSIVVINPKQRQRKAGVASLRMYLELALKKKTL